MYLALEGIRGSVAHEGHVGSISVMTWSFVVDGPRVGEPATGQGLNVVLHADESAPQLFVACMSGRIIPRGSIVVKSGSGTVLFEVELERILVAQMGTEADHDHNQPHTHLVLKCQRVAGVYVPRRADGTAEAPVSGGWDLLEDREWAPTTPD